MRIGTCHSNDLWSMGYFDKVFQIWSLSQRGFEKVWLSKNKSFLHACRERQSKRRPHFRGASEERWHLLCYQIDSNRLPLSRWSVSLATAPKEHPIDLAKATSKPPTSPIWLTFELWEILLSKLLNAMVVAFEKSCLFPHLRLKQSKVWSYFDKVTKKLYMNASRCRCTCRCICRWRLMLSYKFACAACIWGQQGQLLW